jgi:hypothetical protein
VDDTLTEVADLVLRVVEKYGFNLKRPMPALRVFFPE